MGVRLVGINHVALEVGDIDEALAWYGRFFDLKLRGRHGAAMAFVDMGDQFIALARGRSQPPSQGPPRSAEHFVGMGAERHFGLVVDDKEALRAELEAAGVQVSRPPSLDFRDPWGNHIQAVDYRDIQFTKAPEVAEAMGIADLEKSERAKAELRERGITRT